MLWSWVCGLLFFGPPSINRASHSAKETVFRWSSAVIKLVMCKMALTGHKLPRNSAAKVSRAYDEQSISWLSAKLTGQYWPQSLRRRLNSSGIIHMLAIDAALSTKLHINTSTGVKTVLSHLWQQHWKHTELLSFFYSVIFIHKLDTIRKEYRVSLGCKFSQQQCDQIVL